MESCKVRCEVQSQVNKACLLLIFLLLSQDLPENHRDRGQQLKEVIEAH